MAPAPGVPPKHLTNKNYFCHSLYPSANRPRADSGESCSGKDRDLHRQQQHLPLFLKRFRFLSFAHLLSAGRRQQKTAATSAVVPDA